MYCDMSLFLLMIRRQPESTRTDTLFPYTTLFRSQAFAVLLPVKTVGVMGDGRTYDSVCGLRAVTSTDGMTADIYPFDAAFLSRCATRIINEEIGRAHV